MTPVEYLDRLDQRRRYLEARITAKRSVGWETVYDQSERDALAWILEVVAGPLPAVGEPVCEHPDDKRRSVSNLGEEPKFKCLACGEIVPGFA